VSAAPPRLAAGPAGAWATLRRGLAASPDFRSGLVLTLLLAVVSTGGRVVVPVAVQQTLDRGIGASTGPDLDVVARFAALAFAALVATAVAGWAMNVRLARASETALSALRVRAFRHIHDLSLLHQATEHRGALVARVTADIDAISQFLQWGGVVLLVNVGQLLLATVVMAFYSWRLTAVVLVTFLPLIAVLRWFQVRLSAAYDGVRTRVGELLSAVGESVVGAPVVRAYGIQERTNARIGRAVDAHFDASYRAGRLASLMFSSGEVFAAIATAAVVIVGVRSGIAGIITRGELIAFLFLVSLFVGPVAVATEVLNEAQTAIAGWRRVLGVLDSRPDVADAPDGVDIPPGAIGIRFDAVGFAYPGGSEILHDVDLAIPAQSRVAVVGETGSGKTTFAKLLSRLMDPTRGRVLVNDVPLDRVRFASLRRRIVIVPQDGFLFDTTIAENVRYGRPDISDDGIRLAFVELGLADWLDGLPHALHTRVGERGEALSVGERQLIALARAYVANPDLLVLDEATSAVDPVTEVRLARALEGLTRGRTAITIAHRLATAEAADDILVFDAGQVVQRGTHAQLVDAPGPYARLHASWRAQTSQTSGAA
jgi:ATP-binding cassette subfamily B protein